MILNGKTALVTGSGRGIGRAILETFAENGADVFAATRTPGSLDAAVKSLAEKCGVCVTPMYFDVSDAVAVKDAIREVSKSAGQLDVLVNNAGILESALLGMIRPEILEKTFAVNTFGAVYLMQYASRLMARKKKGSIINLSSIMGTEGDAGQVMYSGSKAALVGITRSAAKELAPQNIRVNAIAPGFIDTDMTRSLSGEQRQKRLESIRMNRAGTPAEVARLALFLASDDSAYITGQVIGVDGGMMI
jgi:3-oxoacyl-[acyl-carrier protein] reductase